MTVVTENTGYSAYLLGMTTDAVVGCTQLLTVPFPDEEERDWIIKCCSPNIVCADLTDDDEDKNDHTAFIFNLTKSTDVFALELYKNGVKIADITDNTYGRYWNIGDIDYFDDQKYMCGIEIDWNSVLTLEGVGTYYVRALINGVGYNSLPYKLITYNIYHLNSYIKIESYQNGLLLRQRMNYKSLNIRDCLRVKGSFGFIEKEITTENDLFSRNNENRRELVQRKVNHVDVYNMELLPIFECQADRILNYHFLANELYISDYNSNNYSYSYFRKKVYINDAPELRYSKTDRTILIKAKLIENIQDNEKVNYF